MLKSEGLAIMPCLPWHRNCGVGLTVLLCGLVGLTSCGEAPATVGCISESTVTIRSTAQLRSPDHWQNMAIAGMGFVTGIAIHPT